MRPSQYLNYGLFAGQTHNQKYRRAQRKRYSQTERYDNLPADKRALVDNICKAHAKLANALLLDRQAVKEAKEDMGE